MVGLRIHLSAIKFPHWLKKAKTVMDIFCDVLVNEGHWGALLSSARRGKICFSSLSGKEEHGSSIPAGGERTKNQIRRCTLVSRRRAEGTPLE